MSSAQRLVRVVKFGGSSVGNAAAFQRSAQVLCASVDAGYRCVTQWASHAHPPAAARTLWPPLHTHTHAPPPPPPSWQHSTAAVLSAVFGVTNRLLQCVQHAEAGDRASLARERARLLDGHIALLRALCPASEVHAPYADYIHSTLTACVDDVCREVVGTGRASAQQRDLTSSVGEKWSTKIMAGYLQHSLARKAHFVDAIDLVVTDGVCGDSRPLLRETRARCDTAMRPQLEAGAIGLLTGFYGGAAAGSGSSRGSSNCSSSSSSSSNSSSSSSKGSGGSRGSGSGSDARVLTTLGRGGSDLSAALLGYCLDAAEIQLYKVEYTVDPASGWMSGWAPGWVGIVHCADPVASIPTMHYEEARELSHFEKKVLHPDTVSPAVEKGIPILVRNSLEHAFAGTRIVGGDADSAPPRILTATRTRLVDYEAKQGELEHLPLAQLGLDRASASFVTLVGLNVMGQPGLAERAGRVLRSAGVPFHVPARVNGSRHNFTVLVATADKEKALGLFHRELVLPGRG
jgi:aspartokinase